MWLQVLGVPRDASSDKVAKAYRTRKREAEAARDMEMLTRLEKANDTIMMATLSRRITARPCAAPRSDCACGVRCGGARAACAERGGRRVSAACTCAG